MKILIKNALVSDPQSKFNLKTCDLFINNSKIEKVELISKKAFSANTRGVKIYDAKGSKVSPSWVDMRCALSDPGFELSEDLQTGADVALAGGFSTVVCLPQTFPTIQSKAEVEYIINKSKNLAVSIYPYGCISKKNEGKEIAELFDMHKAGALGFTDGNCPVADAGLMLRTLLYTKAFGGLVISHADENSISKGGRMHEGLQSTSMGVKGVPSIAEELMITRDLELAIYTENRIHFSHISSRGSVEIIRKYKKAGFPVTCDVAVANLCFNEEDLAEYDTFFKVKPPLRSKDDQKALWAGLADGTIDCIVSDHHPVTKEGKDVEFEYADYGMIQLQTAFALVNMNRTKLFSDDILTNTLSRNPRKILGLPGVKIEAGSLAELTIFNDKKEWKFDLGNNKSRSVNSPSLGKELIGKPLAVYCKGVLNEL